MITSQGGGQMKGRFSNCADLPRIFSPGSVGEKILDLGCGTGYRSGRVVGLARKTKYPHWLPKTRKMAESGDSRMNVQKRLLWISR
jgi:ubiquinone/menaquinone biosynthesis C-methylase UbiE